MYARSMYRTEYMLTSSELGLGCEHEEGAGSIFETPG
jgi:hypothetical protein